MRPRNLKLDGFTCYSDPVEIDFADLDLFVISGPTGAGKSTIIDAICYALYGRVPRADAKSTTSLISHNRDNMRVALEFDAGGRSYRVSRGINTSRKTAKNGAETLSRNPSPVQLERRDGDRWEPLQDRVHDINNQIARIIGLDFDAFTKCVLLPQGRFQEFLTGDTKDRRGLLIELLGLDVYVRIMQAANARAKDLTNHADGIDRRLREDYAEATPETLDGIRRELAALTPNLAAARNEREALQQAVTHAETVRTARRREYDRRQDHQAALTEAARQREQSQADHDRLVTLGEEIETTRRSLVALSYDAEAHHRLRIAQEKAKHCADIDAKLGVARTAAGDVGTIARAEAALTAAQAASGAAHAAHLDAQTRLIAVHGEHAAESVRAGLKRGDACPVCGAVVGTLPKAKAASIETADKAVVKAAGEERKHAQTEQAARLALDRERTRIEQAQRQAQQLESERGTVVAEIQTYLPPGAKTDEPSIATAVAALDATAAQHTSLDAALTRARTELDALQPRVAEAGRQIAATEERAKSLLTEAESAAAEASDAKTQLVKLNAADRWTGVADAIEAKHDPGPLLRDALTACQRDVDAMTARSAQLEQSAERTERDIAKAAELRVELGEARATAALYGELGTLLRATNFQEFVLDEAMQALADTASAHLATLYSRFAMTVGGGEFQVIDHWQADQKRPARTLSGGETFVASLALALALSERLPELRSQASAMLESLFLDEGFGTLDTDVLEVVISALERLRSQERMVGIITHVPELARRIESRIEVTTSPAGSTAVVP